MKKSIWKIVAISLGLIPFITINQVCAQKGDTKESHINVVNIGLDSINVICQRTENSIIDTSENYFCWDECFIPAVSTSGIVRIGPGDTVDNFIGDYEIIGGQALTDPSIISYRFYVAENPGDSASITITYGPTNLAEANYGTVAIGALPLPVDEILMTNKNTILGLYPNPAQVHVTVDYTLINEAKTGRVDVRNILGELISSNLIYGAFGKTSLSVEHLSNGVYFCAIVVKGAVQQTRRLVVHH